MYDINRLDFNVTYACNLACRGCISLSDFDRRGVSSLVDIKEQCDTWSKIVNPSVISIFGGEPLMHPKIVQVIDTIGSCWPNSQIRLITNGYLLRKYDPEVWFRSGRLQMQVSIHRHDHEKIITNEIKKIVQRRTQWKVCRTTTDGHRQLQLKNKDLTVYKSKFKTFVMPYRLINGVPKPFNSDPALAHKICGNPDVPILYKNKLYKCAPIANLMDIDKQNTYHYQGLGPNDDLYSFIKNINKPESICAMCPEDQNHSIDHFDKANVIVKDRNLSSFPD